MPDTRTPLLNAAQPIVDGNGRMSDHFRTFMIQVHKYLPIVGEGSPEGIITAQLYSLYIDSTGSAGGIEYRKMQENIAGDKAKGWELV